MPRPMPVMSSAFDSPNSGPSSFSICVFSHRSSRACTASRGAPERRSSAMMRMRGCSASSAATSFATASPVQRMVPSEVSTNWSSGAAASFVARASISLASTCCAAACNAFASEPASAASGAKVNPSSRPIAWPSTITSPVLPISVFKTLSSPAGGASIHWYGGQRNAPLAVHAAHRIIYFRPPGRSPASDRGRTASPAGWRRRSRCGFARSGPTACRYRR